MIDAWNLPSQNLVTVEKEFGNHAAVVEFLEVFLDQFMQFIAYIRLI